MSKLIDVKDLTSIELIPADDNTMSAVASLTDNLVDVSKTSSGNLDNVLQKMLQIGSLLTQNQGVQVSQEIDNKINLIISY